MKTIDYAKSVMHVRGLRTPYALAKYLGVRTQTALNWFDGTTFSEEIAERIARELDIDPAIVQADIRAELAKDDASRTTWSRIAEAFRHHGTAAAVAFVLVAGGTLLPSSVVMAAADNSLLFSQCILCLIAYGWAAARNPLSWRFFFARPRPFRA